MMPPQAMSAAEAGALTTPQPQKQPAPFFVTQAQHSDLTQQLQNLRAENAALRLQAASANAELRTALLRLEESAKKVTTLEEEVLRLTMENAELRALITTLKERSAAQNERIAAQDERIAAQDECITTLKERSAAQDECITTLKERDAAQDERIRAIQQEQDRFVARNVFATMFGIAKAVDSELKRRCQPIERALGQEGDPRPRLAALHLTNPLRREDLVAVKLTMGRHHSAHSGLLFRGDQKAKAFVRDFVMPTELDAEEQQVLAMLHQTCRDHQRFADISPASAPTPTALEDNVWRGLFD